MIKTSLLTLIGTIFISSTALAQVPWDRTSATRPGPLLQAVDACQHRAAADHCSFASPRGYIAGRCTYVREYRPMVCVPNILSSRYHRPPPPVVNPYRGQPRHPRAQAPRAHRPMVSKQNHRPGKVRVQAPRASKQNHRPGKGQAHQPKASKQNHGKGRR